MSTDTDALVEQVKRMLDHPRRDWRFWASISWALLTIAVVISLAYFIGDRNDWREVASALSGGQACRARANGVADDATAQVLIIQGKALAAAGSREPIDRLVAALKVASDNLEAVLDAREAIYEECLVNPAAILPPSVTVPVPAYDDGA